MSGSYNANPAGEICYSHHEADLLRRNGEWIGEMLEGSIPGNINDFIIHKQSASGFNASNQFQTPAKRDDAIEFYEQTRLICPRII